MLELEIGRQDAAELAKQHGRIATWGKGATVPRGWKDAGCVHPDLKGVMMVSVSLLASGHPGCECDQIGLDC